MNDPYPTKIDQASAEDEHRHHYYSGNRIPWYVHLMWVTFWIVAVIYTIRYLFPDLRTELLLPP